MSEAMGEALLSFAAPPLVEVALAVQFDGGSIESLDAAQLFLHLRESFPRREEQHPRPPMEEDFGVPRPPFQIEVVPPPSMPRHWFLSDDGRRLVQVQHDLVAFNWRQWPPGEGTYPRYGALRDGITLAIEELEQIRGAEGKKPLTPNWCEVTYINHIRPLPGENERPPLPRVTTLVADAPREFLPSPEDAQFAQRYRVVHNERPTGRLTVSVASALTAPDGVPIWVMTLTTRLLSATPELHSAYEALDLARLWVVRAFEDLTTKEMHGVWEVRP